jgi:predicted thioesterase
VSPTLALIHSPLVGPLTWQATADKLRVRGFQTLVPSLAGALDAGPPYYTRLAERVADSVVDAGRVILVAHSNAGACASAAAQACTVPVEGLVFVDALLPRAGTSWLDTASPAMRELLHGLARDGMLPPWHAWYPPGALEPLLPDPALRERFCTETPSLPLAYFAEEQPDGGDAVEAHRRAPGTLVMSNLEPGLMGEARATVHASNLASSLGSGSVDVFATPAMVALMERAARAAVEALLPDGSVTVGTRVDVRHQAATPPGVEVRARAELIEVDGRRLIFRVEAFDPSEKIGEGTHERTIVDAGRLLARAQAKTSAR